MADNKRKPDLPSVKLTVFGAGDAFGSHGRLLSSHLLSAPGLNLLLDAGPTLLPGMKRNGVSPADLDAILISHLHGDHFAGLGFLAMEYLYESKPRSGRITIAGPPGLKQRLAELSRALYIETDFSPALALMDFVELRPGETTNVRGAEVSSIRTLHTRNDLSLAFRISVGGKIVAFSGDTGWMEELIPLSAGADFFLCECTYFQTEHDFHLSYPRIAANRERFTAKRMGLTHVGREVLERISEVRIEILNDGTTITI